MKKEFVMRGQTASGETEVLNFSGYKPGYAYRMTEFVLYPSTNIPGQNVELTGTITAGKTAVTSTEPNFNAEGLIATALFTKGTEPHHTVSDVSIVNDTFLITQNLILMVQDAYSTAVNWQCKFVSVKMNDSEEAVTNFKQYTISDE